MPSSTACWATTKQYTNFELTGRYLRLPTSNRPSTAHDNALPKGLVVEYAYEDDSQLGLDPIPWDTFRRRI
jgi:hypothetical protein